MAYKKVLIVALVLILQSLSTRGYLVRYRKNEITLPQWEVRECTRITDDLKTQGYGYVRCEHGSYSDKCGNWFCYSERGDRCLETKDCAGGLTCCSRINSQRGKECSKPQDCSFQENY